MLPSSPYILFPLFPLSSLSFLPLLSLSLLPSSPSFPPLPPSLKPWRPWRRAWDTLPPPVICDLSHTCCTLGGEIPSADELGEIHHETWGKSLMTVERTKPNSCLSITISGEKKRAGEVGQASLHDKQGSHKT